MPAYTVGALAYFNSLSAGMVKVKVIGAKVRELGGLELKLKVTDRSNRYFKRGYVFDMADVWVVPRQVYHKSRGKPFKFWNTPYHWEVKSEA